MSPRKAAAKPIGPPPLTEAQWQAQVLKEAKRWGWSAYHTHDSRRSAAGFPDLVLAHEHHGLLFVELKTDVGKLAPAQHEWLNTIWKAAQDEGGSPGRVRVFLWRPRDAEEVWSTLITGPKPLPRSNV